MDTRVDQVTLQRSLVDGVRRLSQVITGAPREIPIGDFVHSARLLTLEQFVRALPHPVLLYAAADRELDVLGDSHEPTLNRMMIGGGQELREAAAPGLDTCSATDDETSAYRVLVLRSNSPTRVSIGFNERADVRIGDPSLSAIHATVETRGVTHTLRDQDSTGGTQLNGRTLAHGEARVLSAGDTVSLGLLDLTFYPAADFYNVLRRLYVE